jgi:hypothetical protein
MAATATGSGVALKTRVADFPNTTSSILVHYVFSLFRKGHVIIQGISGSRSPSRPLKFDAAVHLPHFDMCAGPC